MDDTINIVRNANLSVEDPYVFEADDNLEFRQDIENHFGAKLLDYFNKYFSSSATTGVYSCKSSICKLPLLVDLNLDDADEPSGVDDRILAPRFSHSFRFTSSRLGESTSAVTAESYLKGVLRSNVTMRDFVDFYYGEYYREGLLNAYIRVLDVYNELAAAEGACDEPGAPRVKIFETNVLDEIQAEKYSGVQSEDLDGEFEDFFLNDELIIPIFKRDEARCLMFAVEMRPDDIVIKLFAVQDETEDEDAGRPRNRLRAELA